MGKDELADLELASILKDAGLFYPNIRKALLISLSQPCTTATVERSFSTLRRVKTWLRSTMTEARLNGKIICNFIYYQKISIYIAGLCMLSVHRKLVTEKKDEFLENMLEKFSEDPRRLLLK